MIEAGFAERVITPAVGKIIPGGFSPRISRGVSDPLQVTACVVRNAKQTVAIIGADAVSFSGATADTMRAHVAGRLGMLKQNVIVAASHTHCGGPTNNVLGSDADTGYLEQVVTRVGEAASDAHSQLQAAQCSAARASCPGWAFNRRFRMRDGREATQPTKGDPDIIAPAGPSDPELGIIAFQSAQGKPLGAIACFACHPTVIWDDLFSGDYPSYWRMSLREKVSPKFTLVFLNGACGDIGPVDFSNPAANGSGIDRARAMGAALAGETCRLMGAADYSNAVALSTIHGSVRVRYRHPTPDALGSARLLVESDTPWNQKKWQARDLLLLANETNNKQFLTCATDLIRIGNAVIAAAPWQPFCEFGLRIKEGAKHQTVLPAAFANGSIGYVPTRQAFIGGGYEPTLGRGSKLAPDAGDVIVAEFLRILKEPDC